MTSDVVHVGEQSGLRYHHIDASMAERLAELELASHPTADPDHLYDARGLELVAQDFPSGSFAGFDGDEIVAMGIGVRRHFDLSQPQHDTDLVIPGDGVHSGDEPDGTWYYGTSIATAASHRRRGIGGELYELRKRACVDHGLLGIVAGGVMPGYADHKHAMTADDYIAKVRAGELYDRTLTFQMDNGFELVCGLRDYLPDPETDNWASLIVWRNPHVESVNR